MAKISVPELLPKDKLLSLPAKEKNEYITNVLKKILEMNPEGITISQIREASSYTYSTIWHHLELLFASEQCWKKQSGNVDIYSPNILHSHLNDKLTDERTKNTIGFKIVENNYGKFLNIYKETDDRLGSRVIMSGISIPISLVKDLKVILENSSKHLNKEVKEKIDSD